MVTKASTQSIAQYQEILSKEPRSKVFAALAENYRELKMYPQAEQILMRGLKEHPNYSSAWVVLGRLLLDLDRNEEAEKALAKASAVDPENLLARQLLGQCYLKINEPKKALKAFKMVLFFSPQNEKAKKAIEKLESLTADEYESEMFEMKPIQKMDEINSFEDRPLLLNETQDLRVLERELSFLDALIARHEITKARNLLDALQTRYPGHSALVERWKIINAEPKEEVPEDLQPHPSREKEALQRKIKTLEALLQRIKAVSTPRF